ncbi:hypothetical protein CUJ83_10995 [Methanocella sp. CWC-04]|uniref:FAS1 domain-containing protein n=1 Tax=Methanooceanicella nereidis TaxID=2052831 RepID=A0AAP2RG63_9EURY|nr:fasciclin domain-containing protein [Methanocella sp. CWC-04]MCD1295525.1 hypothetical protein [Methanocella sp. CWC-04]
MDELRKIVAVLTLSAIMLAFTAPALARMHGEMQDGMMSMEQSNKDMMAAMMDTKDIGIAASTMKTAGIEGMMMPEGRYTLFVASDTALNTMSPDMKNKMMEKMKDRQKATEFVRGHMINNMVMPDDMTDGKTLTLMNGKTMTVRRMDGRMMVDDANIIKAVKTNNGMIYVMDKIPSSIRTMMERMDMLPASAISVSR